MDNADLTLANLAPSIGAIDTPTLIKNVVITAALWALALVARHAVVTFLRKRGLAPHEQRRLVATSRNVVLLVLAIATATVWLDELRTFAVSLVAVAAAIVIATKELIMGAGGTFLRTSARVFDIGDRIEINGLRGDVIDTSLFTTTVLEIGPGKLGEQQTGRSITLPNAILLTAPVAAEGPPEAWVQHTFEIPADIAEWREAEAALLVACRDEHALHVDAARAFFDRRQHERGIEIPALEPTVRLRVDDPRRVTLIAAVLAPARHRISVEQAVVHRYLHQRTTGAATST
jgi:hypothetical protein